MYSIIISFGNFIFYFLLKIGLAREDVFFIRIFESFRWNSFRFYASNVVGMIFCRRFYRDIRFDLNDVDLNMLFL